MEKIISICVLVTMLVGCANYRPTPTFEPTYVPDLDAGRGVAVITVSDKSDWVVRKKTDEMRQITNTVYGLQSTNAAKLKFPYDDGAYGEFAILHVQMGRIVVLVGTSNGQLNCSIHGCMVPIRFDDNKVQRYPARKFSDTNRMLRITDISILRDIAKSKTAIMELDFFSNGPRQFRFGTDGLTVE